MQVGFDDFCSPLVRVVFAKQLNLEDISESSLYCTLFITLQRLYDWETKVHA